MKSSGSGLTKKHPLPKKFKFTTRYCEGDVSLDPGAGLAAVKAFSLNNLFDPYVSGAGHQPIGYDQLMAMYDHYTVIGARARVNFTNTATTAQNVCISLADTSTAVANIERTIENGMCRWVQVGPAGTASATKMLSINCSMSKFFGRSVMTDDIFRGTVGAAPAEQVYLHITAENNTTSNPFPVNCIVEIEYIAILTEPTALAQS